MSSLSDFGNIAVRLSRNPLGVISLLIVLVYGFAGLVATSANFQPQERVLITWFLVLFPVLVVVVFYMLVTRHHTKLYAPGDFEDQGHFIQTLDKKIADSPKVLEIEHVLSNVKAQIEDQPLYRYTRLTEAGKIMALMAFKDELIDVGAFIVDRKFDAEVVKDQTSILETYGWIKESDGKVHLTEDGKSEIATFEDLAYGRMR